MNSKMALMTFTSLGIALLAGAMLPFQAAANAHVGRALGHPFWGAALSLLVSLAVMVPMLILAKVPMPNVNQALQGPWWLWIGGILGAIYVASATVLIPKLGAGGFLVAVVAGQMVMAVVVDHFGVMGLEPKPVNIMRVVGVLLILGGVFLIQGGGIKKGTSTPVSDKPDAMLPVASSMEGGRHVL
jgi:transporter family-2 protein